MEEIKLDINPTSLGKVVNNITDRRNDLKELHIKIKNREIAHKECRDRNYTYDKILKISTLLTSTVTTFLVNSLNDEPNTMPDKVLSFATTVLAGMHAMFNNSNYGAEHHKISRNYSHLAEEIDTHIRENNLSPEIYKECNDKYMVIHDNPLGLFRDIRKKYINE